MHSPEETPLNTNTHPPNLDDSFVESCPSTGAYYHRDLLCAPRPRARSRLNDNDFFQEDNKEVTSEPDGSFSYQIKSTSDEKVEDWASVSAYSGDIFCYLVKLEEKYLLPKDFLANQSEVTNQARAVLVDWVIQVHEYYNFPQDCLYLTISLMDRYMSNHAVHIPQFQVLAMASLLLSCKYEDRFVPPRHDLVTMAANAFSEQELDKMERRLLEALDFDLSQPLPTFFLRRIARAARTDLETYVVSKFLMETAMLDAIMVAFKPSLVAATCFSLASGFVWEGGMLMTVIPGSLHGLQDTKPCVERMAQVLMNLKTLGCKGIFSKYDKLGLSSSIIHGFSAHPLVRDLSRNGRYG